MVFCISLMTNVEGPAPHFLCFSSIFCVSHFILHCGRFLFWGGDKFSSVLTFWLLFFVFFSWQLQMGVICPVHLTPTGFLFLGVIFSVFNHHENPPFLVLFLTGLTRLRKVLSAAWSLELGLMYLSFTAYKKCEVVVRERGQIGWRNWCPSCLNEPETR